MSYSGGHFVFNGTKYHAVYNGTSDLLCSRAFMCESLMEAFWRNYAPGRIFYGPKARGYLVLYHADYGSGFDFYAVFDPVSNFIVGDPSWEMCELNDYLKDNQKVASDNYSSVYKIKD